MLINSINLFRLFLCFFIGFVSIEYCNAKNPMLDVGSVYPFSGFVFQVVPVKQEPNENNIKTFIVEHRVERKIINFDTGRRSKILEKKMRALPRIKNDAPEIRGPVVLEDGGRYLLYSCTLNCPSEIGFVNKSDEATGGLRIESFDVHLDFMGTPLSLEKMHIPSIRAGYTGFRAVSAQGKIIWEKVMLFRTDGFIEDRYGFRWPRNLIQTLWRGKSLLDGDRFFYLNQNYPDGVDIRGVAARFVIKTGDLLRSNKFVASVDLAVFTRDANSALADFIKKKNDSKACLENFEIEEDGVFYANDQDCVSGILKHLSLHFKHYF